MKTTSQLSATMRRCIEQCSNCHQVCLQEASLHCLEAGGQHVAPEHFRLMLACAEMCRTSAAIMSIGVPQHGYVCSACAAICNACADSCDAIDGMEGCASTCRDCARSCSAMAAEVARAA
jgi:hypothetical protein